MGNFLPTFILALILVLCAVGLMAIGWLLTGKARIIRGACGMDPKKLRNKNCGSNGIHCDLCDSDKEFLDSEKKDSNP